MSAASAAAAEPIAAGDEVNRSSRGSNVPGSKPTAIVRFWYGPSAAAWATSTAGAAGSTCSASHDVDDPS